MSSLYDINAELLACIDKDSGEIIDVDRFDELQLEHDEKIENIGLWYKSLLADAEALKSEKQYFADREAKARAKAESLKSYLAANLNGKKFESLRVNMTYRKSQALEYDGISEVPKKWLRYAESTIDKMGIKSAIKKGESIEGFSIKESNNLSIK